jgi:hypothetical protein
MFWVARYNLSNGYPSFVAGHIARLKEALASVFVENR